MTQSATPKSRKRFSQVTFATTSLVLLLLALSFTGSAQQADAPQLKLAHVEFVGLKKLTADQLLKASGLEIGQPITVDALDAAGQKLMDSGLVSKLSYRFQTKANQGTVIFQIEEGRGGDSPVIFDNFVWFTDEELANAVRREVPSFNGTAPTAGQMSDSIIKALQQLLRERKINGTVEYLPSESADPSKLSHVFRLKGVTLPICDLHFPGAHHIDEERLVKTAHELVGADYSRDFAAMFAFNNLFPLYKELGHLRASFGRPQATVENTGECKQGVAVTIPVEEGSIYIWDGAEWTGNQGIPAEQLTKEIKMKAGEVANGLKFDEGIAGALKLYRRKGRLDATIRPQATFDDVARKVSFTLDVKEGPEYHMGQITVKGFSDVLGNYLRGKWELLHDDVFNEGYFEDFLKNQFSEVIMKVKEERQAQGRPAPKKVNASTQAHRDTLTVDVTFEIGDDKPTP